MQDYALYIFDLDGTLYRGGEAVPGAAEAVAELRKRGAAVRFLTNNSSQTPEAQAAKLARLGIPAEADQVLTSGMGAAEYLAREGLKRAFVVGEPGLVEVLGRKGIGSATGAADAVVVGICRTFTYDLLNEAMQRIVKGARFIATNTDSTYPVEEGRTIPGAGAIVAAVRTCTGTDPTVIGKPDPFLIRLILEDTGVPASETLVVGDRYETDIVSGRNAGCDVALALTGVTGERIAGVRAVSSLTELL